MMNGRIVDKSQIHSRTEKEGFEMVTTMIKQLLGINMQMTRKEIVFSTFLHSV